MHTFRAGLPTDVDAHKNRKKVVPIQPFFGFFKLKYCNLDTLIIRDMQGRG